MSRFSIPFSELGWLPEGGRPVPSPDAGDVGFLVIAPWCPDCVEIGPALSVASEERGFSGTARQIWLVGEFATAESVREFNSRFGGPWPLLFGASDRSDSANESSGLRRIRAAFGDERRWGIPSWIEGRIERGFFHIERLNLTF